MSILDTELKPKRDRSKKKKKSKRLYPATTNTSLKVGKNSVAGTINKYWKY